MESDRSEYDELRFIDATALKLIAAASMLTDHIGAALFPDYRWLRIAGRLAMPIFCFCAAEGIRHTGSRARYMFRVFLFALISEYPYDMALKGGFSLRNTQNVMFTFLLAMAGICIFEAIKNKTDSLAGDLAGCLAASLFASAASTLKTDYGMFGVVLVYIFYFMRSDQLLKFVTAALYITAARWGKTQLYCMLSFPLLALYNGERGKGLKYLFYIFYPAHLMILYLVRILIR